MLEPIRKPLPAHRFDPCTFFCYDGRKKDRTLNPKPFSTAIPCAMSEEGQNEFPRMRNKRGYIVGETRDGCCLKVRFKGFKNPITYHRSFIAQGSMHEGVPKSGEWRTNKRHIWTPDHQRKLDALLDGKRLRVTVREAIERIGFPQFPLIQVLDEQNITRGKADRSSRITAAMLEPYVKDGRLTLSGPEIATILGCGYMTMYEAAKRLGIAMMRRSPFKWTEERMALLRKHLRPDGRLSIPQAELAKQLGCSPQTIAQKLWLMR